MIPSDLHKKLRKTRHLMETGNYHEALNGYATLIKQYPRAGLLGEYGRAAGVAGDFDLADRIFRKIRETSPPAAELFLQLAWEYQNLRLHNSARELSQSAADLEPNNFEAQMALAWLMARTNSIDDARMALERCQRLAPSDDRVRYLTVLLHRRAKNEEAAETGFRDLLASSLQDPHLIYSCRAELAGILDRTGRFEEAITLLNEAKAPLQAEMMQRSEEHRKIDARHDEILTRVRALPKNILETWAATFPPKNRSSVTGIAFLSGSARSGTTLLERVLDAHPEVAAADEPIAFETVYPLIDITAPSIPAQRLKVLRDRYLKNLAKGWDCAGQLILDKNPARTIWLPAFLRLFPELRVLIGLRDPRDIMVSLYFQNQSSTNGLRLEQLAEDYCRVMDIWLAVREWQGLPWLQTRYEDMVANLEGEGARVTQFLGLEWHEKQARFFESNREKPIMSTNYNDVSQPVYKRSVGRWRAYEKHLAPALPRLERFYREFGYE